MVIQSLPEDLRECIRFHGHLCPGLVYGYRVAQEAGRLLGIDRMPDGQETDEEILVVAENDSCAVDALQVILGATAGKGNLIIRNYGRNAFTVADRRSGRAVRFFRNRPYRYGGDSPSEFYGLESRMDSPDITPEEKKRQKLLKSLDLLNRDFASVFATEEVPFPAVGYAAVSPSVPCAVCGEMTMETKLVTTPAGILCCIPCAGKT